MRLKMLPLVLVAAVGLIAGPAMAIVEEPDACIDVFFECRDATTYNGPIEFYGTARNCGEVPYVAVYVTDAISGEFLIDPPFPLAPGETVNWSYFVYPESPEDCPAYQKIRIRAYRDDETFWTLLKSLYLEETCDCGPELMSICRTPGFWGHHANDEKKNSQNITQAVIDAAGGLNVCGIPVDNTMLEVPGSALEGMCLHNNEEKVLQLYRHMTAAALNCVMSGAPFDCDGTEIEQLYRDCTDLCLTTTDWDALEDCAYKVDCWNNGGTMLSDGMCQIGTCAIGGEPCYDEDDCGFDDFGEKVECVTLEGTCHDQPLVNEALGLYFEPPGPAGSSKACNAAIKNDCDLLECN